MDNLHFPMYSYTVFNSSDLEYNEPESLKELNRYDYINLCKLNTESKRKVLNNLFDDYTEIKEKGFEYKDYILNRYFYKQFVIRESVDDGIQTRYYKFSLSDWNEKSKKIELDDRILTVDIYTKFPDNILERDVSYKLKVGHKDDLIKQIDSIQNIFNEKGTLFETNLYMVPLYFNSKFSPTDKANYYNRITELRYYEKNRIDFILMLFIQALYRFCIFNYYMLNKVEDNMDMIFENLDTGSFEIYNIVDYIKTHPEDDKKVLIRDFKNNLSIKMDPKRCNIYNHDNKILRTLCEYKFQVRAHYQHYWIGSKKNGDRRKILKWKESYYKNTDKDFKIIKERKID